MTKHIYNLNYYDCEVGIVRDFTLSSDMTKKKSLCEVQILHYKLILYG